MPEIKKREIAFKLRIGDLIRGHQVFEQNENPNKKLLFVELGIKKIVRVNIIANVVDKYTSDGERRFSSITLDDGSGQIRARVFGEDMAKLDDVSQGDTLGVIGVLRYFNQEVYILPEIVRKQDPRYLLVRKLEIEKLHPQETTFEKKEVKAFRDQIIEMIKAAEQHDGVEKEEIIMTVKAQPNLISQEIQKLLEEGIIYEPRPGRVRYLG